MNPLRALLLIVVMSPLTSRAQGVRMSPDFFPLDVGRSWTYDVTNEAGAAMGQINFAVEDYTIISGTSFYVLSQFPFSSGDPEPIRFVRYDRGDRYFLKRFRNDEVPLFLDPGSTTEVLESDAGGAARKFLWRTERYTLIFERGVGIIEARLEESGQVRVARLAETKVKEPAGPSLQPPSVPSPVVRGPSPPSPPSVVPVPGAPGAPGAPGQPASTGPPVAKVTENNPRIDTAVQPSGSDLKFVMVLTNLVESLLPFRFNSGKTYDFVVHDAVTGREVWRWSSDNFFTQVIRSESIRPRARWQFEEIWNRKDNDGNPVPPGKYRMTAILTSTPPLQASPVEFEVR